MLFLELKANNFHINDMIFKVMHMLHYADKLTGSKNFPEYTEEIIKEITDIDYDEEAISQELIHWCPPIASVDPLDLPETTTPIHAIVKRKDNFAAVSKVFAKCYGKEKLAHPTQNILSFLGIDEYNNVLKAIIGDGMDVEKDKSSHSSCDMELILMGDEYEGLLP